MQELVALSINDPLTISSSEKKTTSWSDGAARLLEAQQEAEHKAEVE